MLVCLLTSATACASCRYDKLWHSSVDEAVCQALQAGWKLPRLLEPPLMFLAQQKVRCRTQQLHCKHKFSAREGQPAVLHAVCDREPLVALLLATVW
jgi:hypothetical protein